jgi:hypothetical protein
MLLVVQREALNFRGLKSRSTSADGTDKLIVYILLKWADHGQRPQKRLKFEPTYTIHGLLSLMKSKTCRRMRSPHCSVCAQICVRAYHLKSQTSWPTFMELATNSTPLYNTLFFNFLKISNNMADALLSGSDTTITYFWSWNNGDRVEKNMQFLQFFVTPDSQS